MQKISSTELVRNLGKYSDAALSEPIIITKNGRERLVLLSAQEYNSLRRVSEAHEDAKHADAKENRPDRLRAGRPGAEGYRKRTRPAG